MAIKISVINFKGGVGKTTLTFHFATYLANLGKKVLIIDLDHQSSLSIVILGNKLWEKAIEDRQTCNTIFESFCNEEVSMPNNEIIFKNPFLARSKQNSYPTLDLVSAQFELDDTEIELAATTMGNPIRSEWQKRTLLARWIDSVNADDDYDFILFDCPPATKFVSQNALAASDYFLIPVIPDVMSSRGVTHFKNLVTNTLDKKLEFLRNGASIRDTEIPKSYVAKTEMLAIVPSMAQIARGGYTTIHTEQLDALRRRWGKSILKNVIDRRTGVTEAIDSGWPIWNRSSQNINAAKLMFNSVCEEIYSKL
jgi:chromosome partitioning protein